MHLTVCTYHVTYAFQSESILYSYLNVKEVLARNRPKIWSLSDCNRTRIHNHLVCKRTLKHLAKLAKWLTCVVSFYLCGAFDCMHRTDKYSQHSWIIWPVWLNCSVFVYELSGCGFESRCSPILNEMKMMKMKIIDER